MSNRTYVCFDCRTTERVPALRIARNCRKCHKPAEHVFYKFKIPKRGDNTGWAILQKKVRPLNLEIQTKVLFRMRAERARLERVLSQTPPEKESRRLEITRKLKMMEKQKSEWLRR